MPMARPRKWKRRFSLATDTSLSDAQRSAIMMDELLAHMAEKKTVLRMKINEYIGAVRAWLRAHGSAKLAEYGNTDLAHLLANAQGLAGKAGPAMPVFACADDLLGSGAPARQDGHPRQLRLSRSSAGMSRRLDAVVKDVTVISVSAVHSATEFEKRPSGGQGGVFDPSQPTQATSTGTRRGMGADDNTTID